MPPLRTRATLMFSQRNNPYCELLQKLCRKNTIFLNMIVGNLKIIFNFAESNRKNKQHEEDFGT